MANNVTLPNREEMFRLLSSANIGSDLQSSLQPKLIAQAGNTLDETVFASMLAFAVNSFMASTDEIMRNHVNLRVCEVIDSLIIHPVAATSIKNLFIKLSNASSH